MPRRNHIRPASTAGICGGFTLPEAASYADVSLCRSSRVRICASSRKPLAQHAARQTRKRYYLFDRETNPLDSIEKAFMNKVLLNDRVHQQHSDGHVGCPQKYNVSVECLHEKRVLKCPFVKIACPEADRVSGLRQNTNLRQPHLSTWCAKQLTQARLTTTRNVIH
jgi:hypothetical protein